MAQDLYDKKTSKFHEAEDFFNHIEIHYSNDKTPLVSAFNYYSYLKETLSYSSNLAYEAQRHCSKEENTLLEKCNIIINNCFSKQQIIDWALITLKNHKQA